LKAIKGVLIMYPYSYCDESKLFLTSIEQAIDMMSRVLPVDLLFTKKHMFKIITNFLEILPGAHKRI